MDLTRSYDHVTLNRHLHSMYCFSEILPGKNPSLKNSYKYKARVLRLNASLNFTCSSEDINLPLFIARVRPHSSFHNGPVFTVKLLPLWCNVGVDHCKLTFVRSVKRSVWCKMASTVKMLFLGVKVRNYIFLFVDVVVYFRV